MSLSRPRSLLPAVVRAAAAGAGTALAGPFVGALVGFTGHLLSGAGAEAVRSYAERFGDKAGEKLLELGGDALADRLGEKPGDLESIYRETLRRSLRQIRARASGEFADWFDNWEACLGSPVKLKLSAIRSDQLLPENLDGFFRSTMEVLAAQGAALRSGSTSLKLICHSIPAPLVADLQRRLPGLLEDNFRDVIGEPEFNAGFAQLQWDAHRDHQRSLSEMHGKTDALHLKTDAMQRTADAQNTEILRKLDALLEQQMLLRDIPAAPAPGTTNEPWELRNFVTGPWASGNPVEPRLRAGQWIVVRINPEKPSDGWRDPYGRLVGLWDGTLGTATRFAPGPFRGILRNHREAELRPTALCIPSYKVDVEWREETLVYGALWGSVKGAVVQRFLEKCEGKRMICLILHIGLRDGKGVCKLYSDDYERFLRNEWSYYKGLEAALSTNDLYKKSWSESALKAAINERLMQNNFVRNAMPERYRLLNEHREIQKADVELVLRGLIENYRVFRESLAPKGVK
jgi:hypothetical protein